MTFTSRLLRIAVTCLIFAIIWAVVMRLFLLEILFGPGDYSSTVDDLLYSPWLWVIMASLYLVAALRVTFLRINQILWGLYALLTAYFAMGVFIISSEILENTTPDNRMHVLFLFFIPLFISVGIPVLSYFVLLFRETSIYRRSFLEGRGGSAEWGGPATYKRHEAPVKKGYSTEEGDNHYYGLLSDQILLGRSLFTDDLKMRLVSVKDDVHMVTIGTSGSGKSTTVIWPNLALYEGSVIIFDPKGEHARQTYWRRTGLDLAREQKAERNRYLFYMSEEKKKDLPLPEIMPGAENPDLIHMREGQCYMLDPFNENKNTGIPTACYNPLNEINLNDEGQATAIIAAIADGCVTPESGNNKHFEEHAKSLIEGLIAHVITRYPREKHTLPFLYDLFYGVDDETGVADPQRFNELIIDMMTNDALGGLPRSKAMDLKRVGDREMGSFFSTISRSLKWISNPAMRKQLSKTDFLFSGFGTSKTQTLYIVLPDNQINAQMRWVRTLTSVGTVAMQNRYKKPDIPTLFMLDEFPRLGGKISTISDGFGTFRHYGIKLWIFMQDLSQLQKDYPERWGAMVGTSTVQVFGIRHLETAEWISKQLGKAIRRRTAFQWSLMALFFPRVLHEAAQDLLTPDEVMRMLGKSDNIQIVLPTQGFPMRLERLAYKPLKTKDGGKFRDIGPVSNWKNLKGHFEDW